MEELRRRDPEGCYVVIVERSELERLGRIAELVDLGVRVALRTGSRRMTELILRRLGRMP